LEAYFTVLIELFWSKDRIMEVYLNSIETGPGIYGVEAVAQEHFGCHANELSASQCALIAATLPNPRRFSSRTPSSYMLKRQRQILKEMKYLERR
jgi:monofunctional biosynthetic peptidoglycan transglycosylase